MVIQRGFDAGWPSRSHRKGREAHQRPLRAADDESSSSSNGSSHIPANVSSLRLTVYAMAPMPEAELRPGNRDLLGATFSPHVRGKQR